MKTTRKMMDMATRFDLWVWSLITKLAQRGQPAGRHRTDGLSTMQRIAGLQVARG
jgi:hypothetical protein